MATWRVHVKAPTAEAMEPFKNERDRFKKLYNHGGAEATFELPEAQTEGADAIIAEAKKLGFEASKELYTDPLENADVSADFW